MQVNFKMAFSNGLIFGVDKKIKWLFICNGYIYIYDLLCAVFDPYRGIYGMGYILF